MPDGADEWDIFMLYPSGGLASERERIKRKHVWETGHVLEDPRQTDRSAEKDDAYVVQGNSINQLWTFVSPFALFVAVWVADIFTLGVCLVCRRGGEFGFAFAFGVSRAPVSLGRISEAMIQF
jgi:hypothetical protein